MEKCKTITQQGSPNFTIISKGQSPNYNNIALRPNYLLNAATPICLEHHATYFTLDQKKDSLAGMKIFTMIMLHAWRKRRDEVRSLQEAIEDLKKGSMKAKNQIHVYSTLIRVEQKRNDELTIQLKRSMEHVSKARTSCEDLTTSVLSLSADKALLEQELEIKQREFEAMQTILSQTKGDLFRSMMEQRALQTILSQEQRAVQSLENMKTRLITEVTELGSENRNVENRYKTELQRKDEEVMSVNEKLKAIEKILEDLKCKELQVEEYGKSDVHMRNEIEYLRREVVTLRTALNNSFSYKLRNWWDHFVHLQRYTMNLFYVLAFYLLPAAPRPQCLQAISDIGRN